MTEIIDRKSRIPKYLQIAGWIEEMISRERFQIGERLPSEAKLADLCGVNRNTVRQALSEVVSRGLLSTKNGVGSFIRAKVPQGAKYSLDHISSSSEDIRLAGYNPRTRLISKAVLEASEEISEKLMLGTNHKIIQIVRLRLGDKIPFILERSHLPYEEYKDVLKMDLTGSLYQLLVDQYGAELDRAVQTFRAVLLSGSEARLLKVPTGSPGIFLESITSNRQGVAVELLRSHYRGDRFVFQVHSGNYRVRLQTREDLKEGGGRYDVTERYS